MKVCSIDGCEKPRRTRGWCHTHYTRWRSHGDPLVTLTHATPEDAFLARTEPIVGDPGCIIWTGSLNSDGYGRLRVNGRMVLAHRYAWERERGPIPDGAVLDHTCWERACCNVDHLRIATHQQNMQNRSGAWKGRSLPRGVYRHRSGYQARVNTNGREINAGTFPTIERANIAVKNCRAFYFGEYAGN